MAFKMRERSAEAEMDVGSFSDIAFLLIIFFILTTTFVRTTGREIQVPAGTSEPSETEQKQLTINLSSDKIQYGEASSLVSLDELRTKLQAEDFPSKGPDERMVVLDSREDVVYETYFQVMMAIAEAGGVVALLDESPEEE